MALTTHKDFFKLTINPLKRYLAVRGLNQSGNHAELVARAFVAMEMKAPIISTAEEQKLLLEKDYLDKVAHLGIDDPASFSTHAINDLTKWPNLDTGHIFAYILRNRDLNDTDYRGKSKRRLGLRSFLCPATATPVPAHPLISGSTAVGNSECNGQLPRFPSWCRGRVSDCLFLPGLTQGHQ